MRLRVAAYCRVSTDREDQANSLHSQQIYFRSYIQCNDEWSLAEIYADEGISGTSTSRREAFNRMIRDAEAEKLDLVLTKEVSRFARNTVDTLEYTRRLKQLGVGVIFINDNIDTRDNDGELRLTIMASMAQEESRKTSQRVKWGQKRRMEAGVVFGNDSTFGFHTENGKLTEKPEEAETVRLIYHKFLDEGKGTHVIARELYEMGIAPPKTATGKWSCSMVRRILRNEKYAGDLLQKKYVTMDFLTHRKVENRGQEEQIYLCDHHAPIIDRATWDATQGELTRRNARQDESSKYSNRYWCSGKIRCGSCGGRFVLRKTQKSNGDLYRIWGCHSRVHYGNWKQTGQGESVGCNMRMLNDKTLTACVQFVLRQLDLDHNAIVTALAEAIKQVQSPPSDQLSTQRLQAKQAEIERKKVKAMDAMFSGLLTSHEMVMMKEQYDRELFKLLAQIQSAQDASRTIAAQKADFTELVDTIRTSFYNSEEVFRETIESVTVFDEYIEIRVNYVPNTFRLWFTTKGTRANYTTVIERWSLI